MNAYLLNAECRKIIQAVIERLPIVIRNTVHCQSLDSIRIFK